MQKNYEEYIQKLKQLFSKVFTEMCQMEPNIQNFKKQHIPIARVKKVMKTDEDVNMVSWDAPIIMSKACELFIIDLAYRAQFFCDQNQRKILSVR